jgi:hypothetical protein
MKMKKHVFRPVMMGLVAIAGFGAITMLLWNWLAPGIFGLTAISFWQALGLLALGRILLGGIGIGGKQWMGTRNRRNPIREKWMKMTPEERKEFVKNRHFGGGFGHQFFNPDEPESKD